MIPPAHLLPDHKVKLKWCNSAHYRAAVEWLVERHGRPLSLSEPIQVEPDKNYWYHGVGMFYFSAFEDAFAFKLRWA